MSITPSFGHSFYFDNGEGAPRQPLAKSPPRKRVRPPEIKDAVKPGLKSKMVLDGDGCFGEKKAKYSQENPSLDNSFKIEINNSLFCLPIRQDPVLNQLENPDVKEQAELIVNSTPFQNLSSLQQENVRTIIIEISENNLLETNSKCAELGVLYFYIASKELVIDSNFIQYRTGELLAEANALIKTHEESCPEHLRKQIPTGCKAYLLYAFARMIFPSDGGFNPGGCKALKIMMEGPLQKLIAEEERMQMIRIAERLLTDKDFVLLFQKPFSIQNHLQELISIDLQLHESEEINFIYLRWDLLIALVSSISQHDGEKNCFVIATVSNLLVNSPEILLKMLIEALKTGQMEFSGQRFPVSTMLEGARMNETGFDRVVPTKAISGLIPFSLARESLGIELSDQAGRKMPLDKFMTLTFSEKTYQAKLRYLSPKQNLLQKLLISMVQFAAINTNSKDFYQDDDLYLSADDNQLKQYSNKELLINKFIASFKSNLKTNSDRKFLSEQDRIYLGELENVFLGKLYNVDYNNWKVTDDNKKVSLNFHKQGLNFNGKLSDYNGFIHERRLFYFKNGDLIPVDTITELKNCFLEIVNQFPSDVKDKSEACLHPKIIDFISSDVFVKAISEILFKLNEKECPLEAGIYKESDSFILAQNGCDSTFLKLWEPLRYQFIIEDIKAATPDDFFIKLCGALAKLDCETKGEFAKSKKWVLIECADHLYNICPQLFKEYWADEFKQSWGTENFEFDRTILDQVFLNRVKNYALTADKKERILRKVVGENTLQNHYRHLIESPLDIPQFSIGAKKLMYESLHAALDSTVNDVMNEISTKEIIADLRNMLSGLADIHNLDDCLKLVMDRIKTKGLEYFSSYQLSELIHETLLCADLPVVPSRNSIEKHIRKWASLPEVIVIGNMNWTTTLNEKPVYSYLCMYGDFKKGLTFCYRADGVERPVSDKDMQLILNTTKIYLPSEM